MGSQERVLDLKSLKKKPIFDSFFVWPLHNFFALLNLVFQKTSIYSAKMNNITEGWKLPDIETPLQTILTNPHLSYSKSMLIKLRLLNPMMYYAKINYVTQDWKIIDSNGSQELMRHWYLFNRRSAIIGLPSQKEKNGKIKHSWGVNIEDWTIAKE